MGGRKKRLKEDKVADEELFSIPKQSPSDTSNAASLKNNASAFLENAKIIEAIYGLPPTKQPIVKKEDLFQCYKDTDGDNKKQSTTLKRKELITSESDYDSSGSFDQEDQDRMQTYLSQAVVMYYDASKPGEQVLETRKNFFSDLSTQTTNLFPDCKLVLFGSSVTGLAEAESDLDVCLLTSDPEEDSPLEFLGRLQRVIRKIAKVHFIKSASVPILACVRYHQRSTFEFDISCNRPEGLWNAQIVKHFVDNDSRIAPCLFFLHKLFNISGIKNSKCALLSSFSINISFISYLQHESSLHRVKWSIPEDAENLVNNVQFEPVKTSKKSKKCDGSTGEIIMGYLKWLAEHITSSGTRYFDIRHVSVQDMSVARPVKNMGFGIINPTIPSHDVTRNIGDRQWKIILSGIKNIIRYLVSEVTSPADAHPSNLGPAAARLTQGLNPPKKKQKKLDSRTKARKWQRKQRVQADSHINGGGTVNVRLGRKKRTWKTESA